MFWKILLYIVQGILALVALYFVVLNVYAYVFINPKKKYKKNSKFSRFMLNAFVVFELAVGRIRVHVTGMENLPKDTRFVFVSNHRSKFDPQIQWLYLDKYDLAFISKEANFHVPGYGRLIRKCCFLMIDREDVRQSMQTINEAAELVANDVVSMGVYPEGTRSQDNKVHEFHNGVFKIAQKSKVPIVVATMSGSENIHKNFILRKTDVYFDIVGVIDRDFVTNNSTIEIGKEVRKQMEEGLLRHEPNGENDGRIENN